MEGYALLIGVNEVKNSYYGDPLSLDCALRDTNAMHDLLSKNTRFDKNIETLNSLATNWTNVQSKLATLAAKTEGYIVIYYTGHGASLSSTVNPTGLGFFCFYDRMVLECEIREELSKFNQNLKVLFICDSCFSGELTDVRWNRLEYNLIYQNEDYNPAKILEFIPNKAIDIPRQKYVYENNTQFYDDLISKYYDQVFEPEAEVAILTACGKKQRTEPNIIENGLSAFTQILIDVCANDLTLDTYDKLHQKLKQKRPPYKEPQFEVYPLNRPSIFFNETPPFITDACDGDLFQYLDESTTLSMVKMRSLPGNPNFMYSYSWDVEEDNSQLKLIKAKLAEDVACNIPTQNAVLGVVYVNAFTSPRNFPQDILGMKPDPTNGKEGYVVVIDYYADKIIKKGRTSGKVSNSLG